MPRGQGSRGRGRGFGRSGPRPDNNRASQDVRNEDDGTFNSSLPERFRGKQVRQSSTPLETMQSNGYRMELNMGPRQYREAQERIIANNPNDWRSLPEVPNSEEIALNNNEEVIIPANKIKGKWKSKEKYLRSHYELLREDSIGPIREAVDTVRENPGMMDSKDIAIYEKVHIRGFTFARGGAAARVTFSIVRAGRKINWKSSSRLVSGSILALTPAKDKFKSNCVVAVVAARPQAGLECNPLEIDIYFSSAQEIEIDPQVEWLMIEAKKGFYESLRHTMRALQKLSGEAFPLHNRICSLHANLVAPAYIIPDANLNLSAAIADISKKEPLERVNIINHWPVAPQGYLDDTQWEAMRQILTKDLSIIQGPPGTGKTFVSKVALQIIVENQSEDDPPIIVAAQTNHALDQLLKHVSKFDPEYIRLGGRSKDEDVKRRTLFEVRQANRLTPIPGSFLGLAQRRLDQETQILRETLEPMSPRNAGNPFGASDLVNLGVISKDQADSLVSGAQEWVTGGAESINETKVWLGKALTPWAPVYKEENFGLKEAEEDLEFEQLREHEAESGQTDKEDIELLQGFWCAVEQSNTVSIPPPAVLAKAKQQLDTNRDLWKIPPALRGPVYFVMQEKAKTAMTVRFREQVKGYDRICKDLKTGIFERDAVYLAKAKIIGLTTTGLSKYRPLIASLKPKIILIEEAAEVIEAPVTAACVESLEHLILVGDHKQLQGHCTVDELGKAPYNLNVSMFERLVNNGIPFKTLLCQRRMDPDFRELLGPIYPELQDHPNVVTREPLPLYGMGDVKSYFLDHDWPEMRDAQMSVVNDKEAMFIAGFYEYLMKNKVHPSKITILTFYNGQRKRILKYIRDRPLYNEEYHNVKTVDGYQGEENEIILLSLVRSNDRNIGFLENENRICVALSRAKRAFYIFGNSYALGRNSELWMKVFQTLKCQLPPRVGISFPIQCNKHGRTTFMEFPEDWSEHQSGCDLPCGGFLDCGHACKFTCHPFDHCLLNCLKQCERELSCGHPCRQKCFEACICGECENFTTQGDGGSNGPGGKSGRRGIWDNKSPDRAENYENSWGNSGNDNWGATADTADDGNWGEGAPGTDWGTTWGQRASSDKQRRPKKASGFGQPYVGSSQVLARLPIRTAEEQAAKDGKVGKLGSKSTSPVQSCGQVSQSSRPSTASSTNQAAYRSSTIDPGFGSGSQHSAAKQDKGLEKWGNFANGGVKTDDEMRSKSHTLELKEAANEASCQNFNCSTVLLLDDPVPGVQALTTTTRKDGRKTFNEVYQPVGAASKSSPKSYRIREPSLLD